MNNHLETLKIFRAWRINNDDSAPTMDELGLTGRSIGEALDWSIRELQAATESQGVEPVAEVTGRDGFPGTFTGYELNGYGATIGDKLYTHQPTPTGGGVPDGYREALDELATAAEAYAADQTNATDPRCGIQQPVTVDEAEKLNEALDMAHAVLMGDLPSGEPPAPNHIVDANKKASTDHTPDAGKMIKGQLKVMGSINLLEDGEAQPIDMALVIAFDNAEDIRQAIQDGQCKFSFGD